MLDMGGRGINPTTHQVVPVTALYYNNLFHNTKVRRCCDYIIEIVLLSPRAIVYDRYITSSSSQNYVIITTYYCLIFIKHSVQGY